MLACVRPGLQPFDVVQVHDGRAVDTDELSVRQALFPFPDGLIAASEAGATAAIQPGGSIRDADVIAAADERGMAMIFTGSRHFKH